MKDRATQMGIEHITEIINKPTDGRCIAYAHTIRIANTHRHWPKEAHEATQARLSTLRVLSYLRNIPGAELENIKMYNPQTIESPPYVQPQKQWSRTEMPNANTSLKPTTKGLRLTTTKPMPTL
jgi:hypothetical protein